MTMFSYLIVCFLLSILALSSEDTGDDMLIAGWLLAVIICGTILFILMILMCVVSYAKWRNQSNRSSISKTYSNHDASYDNSTINHGNTVVYDNTICFAHTNNGSAEINYTIDAEDCL